MLENQQVAKSLICLGREHFYMLIISVLQNKQAETQAIFEHHNIRMIALKKSAVIMLIFSGICKEFGDSAKNSPILPIFSGRSLSGRSRPMMGFGQSRQAEEHDYFLNLP